MMRRDFATDSCSSTVELRAILVAGTLGSGAGLVADVVADVARLSLARVEHCRAAKTIGERGLTVERVDIDPAAADRRAEAELLIVCDAEADRALGSDTLQAAERIVVDDGVPAWRQSILPAADRPDCRARRSMEVTIRALAIIVRRLPYDRALWRRSLARHVPKRQRDAVLAKFDAETDASVG